MVKRGALFSLFAGFGLYLGIMFGVQYKAFVLASLPEFASNIIFNFILIGLFATLILYFIENKIIWSMFFHVGIFSNPPLSLGFAVGMLAVWGM